jgi:hypothetical protein
VLDHGKFWIYIYIYIHTHTHTHTYTLTHTHRIGARDDYMLYCMIDRALSWQVLETVQDGDPPLWSWAFGQLQFPSVEPMPTFRTVLEAR